MDRDLPVFALLQRLDISKMLLDSVDDQRQLDVFEFGQLIGDEAPRRRSRARLSGFLVLPVGDERHELLGRQIDDAKQLQSLVFVDAGIDVRRRCRITPPEEDRVRETFGVRFDLSTGLSSGEEERGQTSPEGNYRSENLEKLF